MGLYDYKGDKAALQAGINQILASGETNPSVMRRIQHDGEPRQNSSRPLKHNFKAEAAQPDSERQDKQIANALNGLVDPKTGQMDPAKLEAAGLSARAQRELIAAQETANVITAAANGTRKMSDEALKANHDRTLANLARENPELVQYALDTRRQQAVQMAQPAQAPATPAFAQLNITEP